VRGRDGWRLPARGQGACVLRPRSTGFCHVLARPPAPARRAHRRAVGRPARREGLYGLAVRSPGRGGRQAHPVPRLAARPATKRARGPRRRDRHRRGDDQALGAHPYDQALDPYRRAPKTRSGSSKRYRGTGGVHRHRRPRRLRQLRPFHSRHPTPSATFTPSVT
jgi:hypothetical protein